MRAESEPAVKLQYQGSGFGTSTNPDELMNASMQAQNHTHEASDNVFTQPQDYNEPQVHTEQEEETKEGHDYNKMVFKPGQMREDLRRPAATTTE
jgi:hypothetical protein